jgi:hypothetical protein
LSLCCLSLSLSLVCSLCSSVFFFFSSQEFIPSAAIYRARTPSLSSCGCWSCFRHNFGEITTPTVLPLSDCWGPNFLPKRRVMEAKETATNWALKWFCFLWEFDIGWAFFRCLLRLERPCSREEEVNSPPWDDVVSSAGMGSSSLVLEVSALF